MSRDTTLPAGHQSDGGRQCLVTRSLWAGSCTPASPPLASPPSLSTSKGMLAQRRIDPPVGTTRGLHPEDSLQDQSPSRLRHHCVDCIWGLFFPLPIFGFRHRSICPAEREGRLGCTRPWGLRRSPRHSIYNWRKMLPVAGAYKPVRGGWGTSKAIALSQTREIPQRAD